MLRKSSVLSLLILEQLGRAHHMKFGSKALKSAFDEDTPSTLARR
jgi:hypothetical protein